MFESRGSKVVRRTPARCLCGGELPVPAAGRPRVTCSPACARHRDHLLHQLHRLEQSLRLWPAELRPCPTCGRTYYTRARVRAEVRTLRAEMELLERTLSGE